MVVTISTWGTRRPCGGTRRPGRRSVSLVRGRLAVAAEERRTTASKIPWWVGCVGWPRRRCGVVCGRASLGVVCDHTSSRLGSWGCPIHVGGSFHRALDPAVAGWLCTGTVRELLVGSVSSFSLSGFRCRSPYGGRVCRQTGAGGLEMRHSAGVTSPSASLLRRFTR